MKLSKEVHTKILRGAVLGILLGIYVVIGFAAPLFFSHLKTHIDERNILL